MLAALVVASLIAAGPAAPAKCGQDEVPWKGACFSRSQWEPGDPDCPNGVIVMLESKDVPRCVPCEAYLDGMQQPMNYCTAMRASNADARMKATLDDLLVRLPARAAALRAEQRAWQQRRDRVCRREGEKFEGGSMQPQVESQCLLDRTRKRVVELARMGASSGAAAPPSTTATASVEARCAGGPNQTGVNRRASIAAEKSRFHDQPRMCPPEGECPWRRKAYVVRGDVVAVTAAIGDFACVTYKTTTGWLLRHDLCEAGAACDSKPSGPPAQ